MRLIDADDFGNRMYHEAFEKNSDLQKWDSGCWIRYKLFENVLREQPTVQPETNCSEIPNGSDDTISRQVALDMLDEQIEQCNKALGSFGISPKDEYAIKVYRASLEAYKEQLENLPSSQPETAKRIVGKSRDGMTFWYQCDMCNEPVNLEDSFCSGCGRRLTDG